MKPFFFLTLFLVLTITACKPKAKETANETPATPAPAFPTLPLETLRVLVDNCDYVDIIMYTPSFSMSQGDAASVGATIQQIAETAPVHNPANPATGHIFYQSKGQTLLEADLYLGAAGNYFVFYQEGKPAYANAMTPQGAAFYAQVLGRVQGAPQ